MMKLKEVIGKTILVGLLDETDENATVQYYGLIEGMDEDGLVIKLEDDSRFTLPPTLENISPAEPGVYRMKCSGEHIENPDFISCWKISKKSGK